MRFVLLEHVLDEVVPLVLRIVAVAIGWFGLLALCAGN